ncbi:MAG TPA: alpha/beta hydrolase [Actinomycetota bacterium]|jgi:pimeloyl-ACP methyl ester carboxylesterase
MTEHAERDLEASLTTGDVRHEYLLADGLRLHLIRFPGDGRAAVCLHGVTGNAFAWSRVAERLASSVRVVALDFRGHGDSQWSRSGAYATEDHAGDLETVVASLGGTVDLIGSSWGALVAIAFTTRHPELVGRLVVVDVEASFEQSETDLFPRPHSFDSHVEAEAFERSGNPHAPGDMIRLMAATSTRPGPGGTLVPKHDPYFFERWPFRNDDRWGELSTLAPPVLYVHAGSSFVRRDVMERMAERTPNASLVELPDTTHVAPVDNPEGLADVLAPFLADA